VIKVVCCCSVERLFLLAKWYVCRVGSEVKCSGEVIRLGFVGVLLTMGQRKIQSNKEKAGTEILAHFVNVHPLHVRRFYVEFRALLQRTMNVYCAGLLRGHSHGRSGDRWCRVCLYSLQYAPSYIHHHGKMGRASSARCSRFPFTIQLKHHGHQSQGTWTSWKKKMGKFVRNNGV
jgi:hypothetical protein